MATVAELTALYSNFMLGPRPGPGVCEICFDLTGEHSRCYRCARGRHDLDAVSPISYSVAGEQLHHVLAGYKRRRPAVARHFRVELAAVLWRFLELHETCLARAAGTRAFEVVTTVPSGRDAAGPHPLAEIVGELVGPTRDRHAQVLERSAEPVEPRVFSPVKFLARGEVHGRSVLVIDDTWTTGATMRSAAAALRQAGAEKVAAVVIGRHLHRDFADNDRRLGALARPFDWTSCVHDAATSTSPRALAASSARRSPRARPG